MAAFCRRQSYRGRVDPAVLTQRLKDHLLTGAEGTVAGKSHSALVFAELLGLLNGQLDDYDDALELALAKHPDAGIFTSFPGVGLITASTLLPRSVRTAATTPRSGCCSPKPAWRPVTRSSGRSHRVRFRYAANTRLREACMWWAYNSLKTSPWAREAYDQARARKQHHHRALRGLGARWMRVLWRPGPTASPTTRTGTSDTARTRRRRLLTGGTP
jgi:hypothetical protein